MSPASVSAVACFYDPHLIADFIVRRPSMSLVFILDNLTLKLASKEFEEFLEMDC
jgi:hypothetical protein